MGHAGKEEIKVCGWGCKWRLIKDVLPKTFNGRGCIIFCSLCI